MISTKFNFHGKLVVKLLIIALIFSLAHPATSAETDKTGQRIVGEEDLTVIWISSISFRGSDHQGQYLTNCNEDKFSQWEEWWEDKVGNFIYHKPAPEVELDEGQGQMEIKFQISPNVVISDVEWDIKREISSARWYPGSGTLSVIYIGETDWEDDDEKDDDENLHQDTDCKYLFSLDAPGFLALLYNEDFRCAKKSKYREWVEVKIGTKWYVCSLYKEWRQIMHLKFQDATTGWIEDTSKTNEIVEGTISGFAGSWSEN